MAKYLLAGLAVAVLLVGFVVGRLQPRYETNDDVVMQMISSGQMTGIPEGNLVFTNILIGKSLALLYSKFPLGHWYAAYLYGIHIIAVTVIVLVLLLRGGRWWGAVPCAVFLAIFEIRFLLLPQFTTTAFMIGLAGVLLLLSTTIPMLVRVSVGATLILLCGLIRVDVLWILLPMMGPLLLYAFWTSTPFPILMGVMLGAGMALGADHYMEVGSSSREWREFMVFNDVRGWLYDSPFHDCSIVENDLLVGAQWSRNDFLMMKSGFMDTRSVYSTERCDYFLRHSPVHIWGRLRMAVVKVIGTLREGIRWVLPGFVLIGLCMVNSRDCWRRWLMVCGALVALVLLMAIACVGTLKLRVTVPVIAAAVMTGLWLMDDHVERQKYALGLGFWRENVLIGFTIIAVIGSLYGAGIKSRLNQRDIASMDNKVKYLEVWRDKILILWGDMSLPFQNVAPFEPLFHGRKAASLYSVGWMSQSPYNEQIVVGQHARDILLAMLNSDSFRLVLEEPSSSWLGVLGEFYREHYGERVQFGCEGTFSGGVGDIPIKVYKVSRVVMPPPTAGI